MSITVPTNTEFLALSGKVATLQIALGTLTTQYNALLAEIITDEAKIAALQASPAPVIPPVVPPPVPVVPPIVGSFAVPDLLNNASFELGWDGFIDWSFGSPGPANVGGFSCVRSQEQAKDGLWSVKSSFAPNSGDNHVEFGYAFGDHLDVYARVWFYLTGALPTSHRKWIRFQTVGYGGVRGGLYLSTVGDGVSFVHAENSQIDVDLGIGIPTFNVWHSIEVEYDRTNWSVSPRARFWYDGLPIIGPSPTKWFGSPGTAYWDAEWLYAGAPSGSASPSAILVFDDTVNGGNTATGSTFYDRIAVSTQRIGP